MTATALEQRKNIRLAVHPDNAQVSVLVNGAQQQGVLVNQSSEGFGLLVVRGLRIDSGHSVRVVSDDGVHECQVCHSRPEDNYQLLGLRRVADIPFVERPQKQQSKRYFRYGMGGGLASCVVLGGGILACMWCVWNGPPDKTAEERAAEQKALAAQQRPDDMAPSDEQLENRERLRELAESGGNSTSLSEAFFSRLTGTSGKALRQKLMQRGLNWNGLIEELSLTSSQQDSVQRLLTSTNPGSPATARNQLRGILNGSQKAKVDRLAAEM